MNTVQIVEQVKEVIVKELFTDVDDKHCVLDLYIENNDRTSQQLSKVSRVFFNHTKSELTKEYNSGKILFFRKYNYEKILIRYLENKYKISEIEFSLFPSDKKKQELEEKQKQEIEIIQRKNIEQNLIKQISHLKWKKTVRASGDIYTSIDENEKKIELHYRVGNLGKKNKIVNELIYDNQPLKYIEYDVKEIVDIIEKTHPRKLKADHVIMVISPKYSRNLKNTKEQDTEQKVQKQGKKKQPKKKHKEKKQQENGQQEKRNIVRKNMSPIDIKMQILQINNPKVWKFLDDISQSEKTGVEDLIIIYERIIKQCSCHKNGMCVISRSKCDISQQNCLLHKRFIEGIRANKKKGIVVNKTLQKVKNTSLKYQINIKDFVVRRTVFKCMHEHHKIENIDAEISIDCDGKKQLMQIPAGYCRQCNTYFIMESTYQKLKNKGIILCRITDEKTYMKGLYVNGMQLAQESILMQYGYNVSQTEGLSQRTRQKILALLIDNKALSKSEIISYLDFFISQRAGRSSMELAISKWETDREFVENYRIGEYTQYGINAIYRR